MFYLSWQRLIVPVFSILLPTVASAEESFQVVCRGGFYQLDYKAYIWFLELIYQPNDTPAAEGGVTPGHCTRQTQTLDGMPKAICFRNVRIDRFSWMAGYGTIVHFESPIQSFIQDLGDSSKVFTFNVHFNNGDTCLHGQLPNM